MVVTRPESQAQVLCDRLRALGAYPIKFPVIAIVPAEPGGGLDQAIEQMIRYDWIIFTSVNGVEHFWARMEAVGTSSNTGETGILNFAGKVAAIGPATAVALRERGAVVHLMPDVYCAEAILDHIGNVADQCILLPRADIARPDLADNLRARGSHVYEVATYCTVSVTPPASAFDAVRRGVDVVTFTSSSTVRHFVKVTAELDYGHPLIACIGPVTAATARKFGLHVDTVAQEYTVDGLVEAMRLLWTEGSR